MFGRCFSIALYKTLIINNKQQPFSFNTNWKLAVLFYLCTLLKNQLIHINFQ
jgi:hypothetical protein